MANSTAAAIAYPKTLFPDYECYLSPGTVVNDAPTSRLCGGVSLLVHKRLNYMFERIWVEFDHIIVMRVANELLGTAKPVFLIAVYLPPTGSVYYDDTDIVNKVSILEQCMLDIVEQFPDALFLIIFAQTERNQCAKLAKFANFLYLGFFLQA